MGKEIKRNLKDNNPNGSPSRIITEMAQAHG